MTTPTTRYHVKLGALSVEQAGDAVLLTIDAGDTLIRIHLLPDCAEEGALELLEAASAARRHACPATPE